MTLSDYVTVTQVAAAAGVNRRTVHSWIKAGRLDAEQIGSGSHSAFLVTRAAAEALIADRASEGARR